MTATLVSVVIPLYNGERHIADALRSVFAQTHAPLEVIVVDDGSTDGGAAIAQRFPVRYAWQPNAGQSTARNAGVALASGELIAFLDQDDIWEPEKLVAQVAALAAHPEAGYALCQVRYTLDGPAPAYFRPQDITAPENGYVPSCWLVRREAFDRVGGFDPAYRRAEDVEWIARAKDGGVRSVVVPQLLVWKRVHATNTSGGPPPAGRELLDALRASAHRQTSANDE